MNELLQLRPWQVDELRLYVGGPIPRVPSTNLLRRGLVYRIAGRKFVITAKGAGALAEYPFKRSEFTEETPRRSAQSRLQATIP